MNNKYRGRHFRMILRNILKKQQAASFKLQALTAGPGYDRINLERININYGKNNYRLQSIRTYEKNSRRPGGDLAAGKERPRGSQKKMGGK